MTIREHIQQKWNERLDESEVLVVYDPERRYEALAADAASASCTVVDASKSVIEGREAAMEAFASLGASAKGEERLLVYVPRPRPVSPEERQRDPFYPLVIGGAVFPDGEQDLYKNLCLAAKPDHRSALEDLFATDPNPAFDTVDLVDGGAQWPTLRGLLGVDSAREIVLALIAPSDTQKRELEEHSTWQTEYYGFAEHALGLSANRRLKKWESIREELVRYVLFSELALDLPGDLPEALSSVPAASEAHRDVIYSVCASLRDSVAHRRLYVQLSTEVEQALDLRQHFAGEDNFGLRDTFQFEERAYLRRFAEAAVAGELDEARSILEGRRQSVWVDTENRGIDWDIARRGLDLLDAFETSGEEAASPGEMVAAYVRDGRSVDTAHRSLEHLVQDAIAVPAVLGRFVQHIRSEYRAFAEKQQHALLEGVQASGWPPTDVLRQGQIFDRFVAPVLERHGQRVALVMVDALRYELAAELHEQLRDRHDATLHAAAAQLPTITPVGMASLLPKAAQALELRAPNGKLVPVLDGEAVVTPADRLAYTKQQYGDRVAMLDLDACLKNKPPTIGDNVHLLLIKTTEIDAAGEALDQGLLTAIARVQKKLLRLVHVLQEMGFERILMATDHGFIFSHEEVPGDKVTPPAGEWLLSKERCLLGTLQGATSALTFEQADVGIRGDVPQFVLPAGYGVFRTGSTYLHGGLSLQEAVLPVLVVELQAGRAEQETKVDLQLSYRGGDTDRITTRLPMIEIALFDIFGPEELTFRLEALASKGSDVVGEPPPSGRMDASTGLITIKAGEAIKVALRMDDTYEGTFMVQATDPVTQVSFGTLKLRTDYVD